MCWVFPRLRGCRIDISEIPSRRGVTRGLFIGVFWFFSASVLSRGGCEGGLPDLRQFKVFYYKDSQMKDKPLP